MLPCFALLCLALLWCCTCCALAWCRPVLCLSTSGSQAAAETGGEFRDRNCSVCLDSIGSFPPEHVMCVFRCGHVFCHGCIEQWFCIGRKSCPNCNKVYSGLRHSQTLTVEELLKH